MGNITIETTESGNLRLTFPASEHFTVSNSALDGIVITIFGRTLADVVTIPREGETPSYFLPDTASDADE